MRKNLYYLLLLIVLGCVFYYLKLQKDKTNFSDAEFRVENINEIGSVLIQDKIGNKTELVKKDNQWFVNGTYLAQESKIIVLLETLNKLQVEFPVGESNRKNAIDDLRKFGIEIKIKDKNEEEIKTIFLGNQMQEGNFMILSQNGIISPDPYIVKLPGDKADLKYRFNAEVKTWMSTSVFSIPINDLYQIKVDFKEMKYHSFLLEKDEEVININPLTDSVKLIKTLNREHTLGFILEFENKHFEQRITTDSIISEIKKTNPYAEISAIDIHGKKQSITLYRKKNSGQKLVKDNQGKDIPYDIERYWGYVSSTKEYVTVQHYVFGPILQPYSYFFEQKK